MCVDMSTNILVIYITREQALDKILGFMVNETFSFIGKQFVLIIFDPETKRNHQDRVSGYYSELAAFANKIIIIEKSKISKKIYSNIKNVNSNSILVSESSYIKNYLLSVINGGGVVYALVRWNESGEICHDILWSVRKSGGDVYRYFKSVHDVGFGATSSSMHCGKISVFLKSIRLYFWFVFKPKILNLNCYDNYWCYEQKAFERLRCEGVPFKNIKIITYPLSTKSWAAYAQKRAGEICLVQVKNRPLVCIFAKGPVSGRPDDTFHQVMSTDLLFDLLKEIKLALDEKFNLDYDVVIKPHPNQSLEGLRNVLESVGWLSDVITNEGGAFLIANANLVITLYSSVCVEAAYQGVKVVDFYRPTPYFNKVHPLGVPWGSYGIPIITNYSGLVQFLDRAELNR